MKLNLIFQFLLLALTVLLLFSCGNQSNGVFGKRKHLKGWHFRSGNKPIDNDKISIHNNYNVKKGRESQRSSLIVENQYLSSDMNLLTDRSTRNLDTKSKMISGLNIPKEQMQLSVLDIDIGSTN